MRLPYEKTSRKTSNVRFLYLYDVFKFLIKALGCFTNATSCNCYCCCKFLYDKNQTPAICHCSSLQEVLGAVLLAVYIPHRNTEEEEPTQYGTQKAHIPLDALRLCFISAVAWHSHNAPDRYACSGLRCKTTEKAMHSLEYGGKRLEN